MIVWIIWALTVVVGVLNGLFVCWKIEQLGEARLGATGHLLRYQSEEVEK